MIKYNHDYGKYRTILENLYWKTAVLANKNIISAVAFSCDIDRGNDTAIERQRYDN